MSGKIPGYEILHPIAEGGMASVYLAVQESLGRHVALKLLKKFDHPEQARRFRNEGRIIASLNHRNIITIHDIGVHEDKHYISMEYLEGGDLEARIRAGMHTDAALALLEVMGSCLDFLHARAIVHRDIKPANILFHKDGTPILTDFGVARELQSDLRLTMEGSAVGSPHYLSPEQAECKPLDGRTDIYSLGIIFYEMITGEKPFQGDSHIETIVAHLTEPVPTLPLALQQYQGLLERMIAKDPGERFDSAGEMLAYLRKARQRRRYTGVASLQHACRSFLPGGGSAMRARLRWAAMGVLAAVIAVTGVIGSRSFVPEQPPPGGLDPLAVAQSQRPPQPDTAVTGGMQPPLAGTVTAGNDPASVETATQPATPTGMVSARPGERRTAPAPEARPVAAYPPSGAGEPEQPAAAFSFVADEPPAATHAETLRLAQQALDEYRLTTPPGNNAHDYYRSILAEDPDNEAARAGVASIARVYANLAERERDRFHYAKARTYIERGLAVDPGNERLRDLESTSTISGASQRAFGKVKSLFQ